MSQPLPAQIDPFQLADSTDKGASLAGTLMAAALPRLQAAVLALDDVTATLDFIRDAEQHCIISGTASAIVTLPCQRCLEPARVPLQAGFRNAVVRDEAEAERLPAELEPVIGSHNLALAGVVEDELLLALPLVPRHEDSATCGPRAKVLQQQAAGQTRPNPFAVLKNLKKPN